MVEPVLALDIGGTKIAAAVIGIGPGGAVIDRFATAPTPAAEGPASVIAAALDLAERLRNDEGIRAVGIASAGVIDTRSGRVTHATGSLTDWAGTDLLGPFVDRFAVPVGVLNDVHAHGIGEARFGAGRGASSTLLVAVGTGIGGCHLVGGIPLLGARGAAGHMGHLPVPEAEGVACPCGRTGHLEGLASGPGIVRLAGRLGAREGRGPVPEDGRRLAHEAGQGDTVALEAYRIAGFATGRVIGALLNALDPAVVVLTGGVAEVGGHWRDAVDAGIGHDAMDAVARTPVLPARAGAHAALIGAAAHALEPHP